MPTKASRKLKFDQVTNRSNVWNVYRQEGAWIGRISKASRHAVNKVVEFETLHRQLTVNLPVASELIQIAEFMQHMEL